LPGEMENPEKRKEEEKRREREFGTGGKVGESRGGVARGSHATAVYSEGKIGECEKKGKTGKT